MQQINSPRNDKIVFITHPPYGFDDLALIISNYFHSFQAHTQLKAELREIGRIRIDCLIDIVQPRPRQAAAEPDGRTLPPRTSSPMMMHPAVWIMRLVFSCADVMICPLMPDGETAAEV